LTDFAAQFPRVRLHFTETQDIANLRDSQSDLMIGHRPVKHHDIVCTPLGALSFTPVATRTYLDRAGPATRYNLERHWFLQSSFFHERDPAWTEWHRACVRGHIAHVCDNILIYRALAEAGAGIALLGSHEPAIPEAVTLDIGCVTPLPLYGLALAGRLNSRPVKLVFEWICDQFRSRLQPETLTAPSVTPCAAAAATCT
jgi:DNA-binding transcriptional LysR family regulator